MSDTKTDQSDKYMTIYTLFRISFAVGLLNFSYLRPLDHF